MNKKDQDRQSVLCVDDAEDVREILHEVLTLLGHTSITAVDGLDALEKLAGGQFDIVITDLKMPRMGGIELIKKIKADFEEVDVIAITAHEADYKYTDVIEVGAADFISKPFNVNELEAKINRIIRERDLRSDLKRLSTHDGLTGIYNRRYFNDNLEHEAVRAMRQNYNLFLLIIDVDKFKGYNDKHGHLQGDSLLMTLARIILANIRKDVDSAYRYGGDEFAVVLPYANQEQALKVAKRLLTEYNKENLSPTSLSIGLAKLEGTQDSLEEDLEILIKKADQALYLAKNKGGNQVCDEVGQVTLASPYIIQHDL